MMSRAIEGGRLFNSDVDRKLYLGLLQVVVERHRWQVMAFALMDNHVHALVEASTDRLSAGMWWLNWKYAEYYKSTYQPRFGHVFGGRPKTKPIENDRYFLAVVRYIARNPVGVACLRPEEYRWSSYRSVIGAGPPLPLLACDRLLEWFGPADPVALYRAFVTGGHPADHGSVQQWAAGALPRPQLEDLVAGGTPADLLIAHETWGYSPSEICRATGLSYATVWRMFARRK